MMSLSFSIDVVPTIGALTPSRAYTHASAICAIDTPRFFASSSMRGTIASLAAYADTNWSEPERVVVSPRGRAAYPRARGDHGMEPTPNNLYSRSEVASGLASVR